MNNATSSSGDSVVTTGDCAAAAAAGDGNGEQPDTSSPTPAADSGSGGGANATTADAEDPAPAALPLPRMQWHVGDVTNMDNYRTGQFDVIIDKGTLDALRCTKDSNQLVHTMLTECSRLLLPGGKFVCVASSERGE